MGMFDFFTDPLEDFAEATGIDNVVHAAEDTVSFVDNIREDAVGAVVSGIEDVCHATGIDEAVHSVTGGKRLLSQDGKISGDLISEVEDAFHNCGIDNLVHLATGGERLLEQDGTIRLENLAKVAVSISEAVSNPAVVGPARAVIKTIAALIGGFIDTLKEKAHEVQEDAEYIKAKVEEVKASFEKISEWLSRAMASIYQALPELPDIVEEFEKGVHAIKDIIPAIENTVCDLDRPAKRRRVE